MENVKFRSADNSTYRTNGKQLFQLYKTPSRPVKRLILTDFKYRMEDTKYQNYAKLM